MKGLTVWNRDSKSYPKTTISYIDLTSWPGQVDIVKFASCIQMRQI